MKNRSAPAQTPSPLVAPEFLELVRPELLAAVTALRAQWGGQPTATANRDLRRQIEELLDQTFAVEPAEAHRLLDGLHSDAPEVEQEALLEFAGFCTVLHVNGLADLFRGTLVA